LGGSTEIQAGIISEDLGLQVCAPGATRCQEACYASRTDGQAAAVAIGASRVSMLSW
jgi:hypothetical protein